MAGLLQDKVAWVTGAAAGIGESVALYFAEQGAKVAVLDRDHEGAAHVAAAVESSGSEALALGADVGDAADLAEAFDAVLARFSRLDILVNNAGIYPRRKFVEMTEQEWEHMLNVNLNGVFRCSKLAAPHMIERGAGKIVNISSVTFFLGMQPMTHYVSSKGGIIGFTRSLARELGPHGIHVNSLSPGAVKTESEKKVATEEQANAIIPLQSLQRRILPLDIARVCAFLASPLSDGMTGQTLNVDGGWVMH